MKKVISVLLAVLMIFSVFGMTLAYAEEEKDTYTITFVDYDGTVIKTVVVEDGEAVEAPEYPTREDTEDIKYIFKGWKAEGSDELYHKNTIPAAEEDTTYTAVYSEQKIEPTTSFFALIRSIFERFNILIEYFFRVFGKKEA